MLKDLVLTFRSCILIYRKICEKYEEIAVWKSCTRLVLQSLKKVISEFSLAGGGNHLQSTSYTQLCIGSGRRNMRHFKNFNIFQHVNGYLISPTASGRCNIIPVMKLKRYLSAATSVVCRIRVVCIFSQLALRGKMRSPWGRKTGKNPANKIRILLGEKRDSVTSFFILIFPRIGCPCEVNGTGCIFLPQVRP